MHNLSSAMFGVCLMVLAVTAPACGKSAPKTAPKPAVKAPAPAPSNPPAPTKEVAPAPTPAAATPAKAAAAEPVNPRVNAWAIKSAAATVKAGDRAYVLTRGRNRSHTDRRAVYHLYAHDVRSVAKDLVTLKEMGGSDFQVSGSFVIPAGVASAKALSKGDFVLAEWASSLKHAVVVGFQGAKVKIRYTDLPDSWSDDKITATKSPRELTQQKEGLSPGNFAVAKLDGQQYLVLLVAPAADKWVVRRFAGRVDTLPTDTLTPIPLKPKLRRRQRVTVPWIGMMYPGSVRKVKGVRAHILVDGIGQKKPIIVPLGQVLPRK
ncbi:MAG: hypothetical protein KC502_20015 [Myxococcales bacterium]|nr:hypothetical protein [Myxococcales bacterium]